MSDSGAFPKDDLVRELIRGAQADALRRGFKLVVPDICQFVFSAEEDGLLDEVRLVLRLPGARILEQLQ